MDPNDPIARRRQQLARLIQKRTDGKYTKILREVQNLSEDQVFEQLKKERS